MPHFWSLIWAGPRFLVRNLCNFQNSGVNLKQTLDFWVIFENNVHSKIHFEGSNFLNFLSNNPLNLLLYILKFSIFGFTFPVVNLDFWVSFWSNDTSTAFSYRWDLSSPPSPLPLPLTSFFIKVIKCFFKHCPMQLLTRKNL